LNETMTEDTQNPLSVSNKDTNGEIENVSAPKRREFFKKMSLLSVSAVASTTLLSPTKAKAAEVKNDPAIMDIPEWGSKLGKSVNWHPYGLPSPYQHNIVRRSTQLLSSGDFFASVAMCPIYDSSGIITPNGLFFNRDHGGTAIVDPNEYRLMIDGLVEKPLVLTLEQLKRYPAQDRIYFIECPANGSAEWRGPQFNSVQFLKGMMSCAQWTGVKLSVLLEDVGVKPEAAWMLAEGSDNSEMGRTIPMGKVMDDAMVVWAQNGEALRPEQGYPVRLLVPGWEGNLNVKWLRRLKFGDKPWHAKEETSKYTMLQPNGKAIQFFWPLEVNSIITSPCPERPWTDLKPGDVVEISGLAWSGQGTITRVDISFDGGDNWVEAELSGLVLPKAWTRFVYQYKWEGKPILLASRSRDDSGNIQPTVDQEVDKVGVESIYHRNAICTWEVTAKGVVNNVQIRDYAKEEAAIKKLRKLKGKWWK
jgi:sulfane dehydrogenase subunit SoxC